MCALLALADGDLGAVLNGAPTDETPVLFDSSRDCNLLALFGAHRRGQLHLCQIVFDRDDSRAGAHGSDVQHQHFAFAQLGDFAGFFGTLRLDA